MIRSFQRISLVGLLCTGAVVLAQNATPDPTAAGAAPATITDAQRAPRALRAAKAANQQAGPAETDEARRRRRQKLKKIPPEFVDINLSHVKIPSQKMNSGQPDAVTAAFPDWDLRQPRKKLMEVRPLLRTSAAPEYEILTFLSDQAPISDRRVVDVEAGGTFAHEGQYVVVELSGATVGDTYLILGQGHELRSSQSETRGFSSPILGEVQVLSGVNSEKNYYRAKVVRATAPVIVGALATPGKIERVVVEAGGRAPSGTAAKLVGGAGSDGRQMFGPGEFVYLDSGQNSGVSVGENLTVYRNQKSRGSKTISGVVDPQGIGSLQVLKVTSHFSLAVVVSASEEIRVGDSTTRASENQ